MNELKTPLKMNVLCERIANERSSQEERVVHAAAALEDRSVHWTSRQDLDAYRDALSGGALLPVGTIAFLRAAMRLARIIEPENISYPQCLSPYLHRHIEQRRAGEVLGQFFVKPVATKTFTGCVFDTLTGPEQLNEHDRLQYNAFLCLPPESMVWAGEVVEWLNETRYYVLNREILGVGFYGEYPDEAPVPDEEVVREMAHTLTHSPGAPCAFALDVGVLSNGKTALVECNDAWALGYYKGTLSASRYLEFMRARWCELLALRE